MCLNWQIDYLIKQLLSTVIKRKIIIIWINLPFKIILAKFPFKEKEMKKIFWNKKDLQWNKPGNNNSSSKNNKIKLEIINSYWCNNNNNNFSNSNKN